mgnify:CR=1 FL=1
MSPSKDDIKDEIEKHEGTKFEQTKDGHVNILVEGTRRQVSDEKYERIQKTTSWLARGLTPQEVYEEMSDRYESKTQLKNDVELIKRMDNNQFQANLLEEIIQNLILSNKEAKRRFWEISDMHMKGMKETISKEDESDASPQHNPFASIKAAKHAFQIDKEMLKTLSRLGFDLSELKARKESQDGDNDADMNEIDQKLEALLGQMDPGEAADMVDEDE